MRAQCCFLALENATNTANVEWIMMSWAFLPDPTLPTPFQDVHFRRLSSYNAKLGCSGIPTGNRPTGANRTLVRLMVWLAFRYNVS